MTSQDQRSVADRRAHAAHTSMFLRMLVRAAVVRPGRAASALLAMVVAAAVATAMMNLYVDVQAKLRKEFRSYGANVVVVGKDGASLPADALTKIESVLGGRGMAVPFAYVVARTANGQSVVVAGTDFERVQKLDRWWSVNLWPEDPHQALVGMRAMQVVSPAGQPFDLTFQGHTIHLDTGRHAANRRRRRQPGLSCPWLTSLAGPASQPSTIEVAANGSPDEVNATIQPDWRSACRPPTFIPFGRSSKAKLACSARRVPRFTRPPC